MFEHFIFTRFNLLDRKTDIYNNPMIPDPKTWMQHRIKLFEQYTLPGMIQQTNKNFTWLLAFSPKTPSEVLYRYDYFENVKIIFEYPMDWMIRQIPTANELITSRIDNDDFYHPLFIETIQSVVKSHDQIIDIDYDQLDHATGNRYTSLRQSPNSPFITLVEPWGDDIKTVFHCSHTNMIQNFVGRKINKQLATMVIHDRNISNKIIGDKI